MSHEWRIVLGRAVCVVAIVAALLTAMTAPATAAFPPTVSGADTLDFHSVQPARLADTRPGRPTVDGQNSGTGVVSPGAPLEVKLGDRGGLIAAGFVAVSLNVTVVGSTWPGYITVYPRGEPKPNSSNLNFAKGQIVANSVTVMPSADGYVEIYTSTAAHVLVDVTGYFTAGGLSPLPPKRLADTRPGRSTVDGQDVGTGVITTGAPRQVQIAGRAGIPESGVTAVVLNVTVDQPSARGYLTAYPTGSPLPETSSLNFTAGRTVANSVVSKIGSGGQISLFSSAGSPHAIVDISGYFTSSSQYVPLQPARFADTRSTGTAVGARASDPGRTSTRTGRIGITERNGDRIDVLIEGRGDVPERDVGAVVLNVTVTGPTSDGHVRVFPLDSVMPTASSVNFGAGQTIPNLVIAKVGRGGGVSIYNAAHGADVIVDVVGYFPGFDTHDVAGRYAALANDIRGVPLSYDRCYPIYYLINEAGAPPGWVDDVFTAMAALNAAAETELVGLGFTDEVPDENRSPIDADGYWKPILIAFTTPSVIPSLGGSTVGIAGSNYVGLDNGVQYLPQQYFSGTAYFDRTEALSSGFGAGNTFGKVALHEFAHIIGLGHVDNLDLIMNPFVIERAGGLGTGDLEGLGLMYRTQPCPDSLAYYRSQLSRPRPGPPPGAEFGQVSVTD